MYSVYDKLTVSTSLLHLPLASWSELEEDLQLGQNGDQGSQSGHHCDHGHHLPAPASYNQNRIKHCLQL